jgi:membrane protease subunit (stomatin/prohibitin family)
VSLWDRLTGELVDVIDWVDPGNDTMAWRYERRDRAIRHGAKLTVREGQMAVFVNEGQVADVFGPGMYELYTANLPVLASLLAWPHGFESPFKADVYFFSTRRFTDLKWGTRNPVILRDPEFGPLRLRAYGTYSVRIREPATFLKEIVGTDGSFTTEEMSEQIRNLIVADFAAVLGASQIPVLDLAASYAQLGRYLTERIGPDVAAFGLDLLQLLVENVSLPPEVEQALDRRTSMGMVGDLERYGRFQAAEALRAAASNPGLAGAAVGMALGTGLVQGPVMREVPPPLPSAGPRYHVAGGGAPPGAEAPQKLAARVPGGRVDAK